jgi:hypothetical protein
LLCFATCRYDNILAAATDEHQKYTIGIPNNNAIQSIVCQWFQNIVVE